MNKAKQKNIEAIYPLSPMQQGMLFHALYEPGSSVYFEQTYFNINGDLNIDNFKRALQETLNRYAVLRTSFIWKKLDKLLQIVHKQVELPFIYEDWRSKTAMDQEKEFEKILSMERQQGFDLAKPPLVRVSLFQTGDNSYKFLWNNHHLLFDGWSMPVIFKDVFTYYEMFRLGKELPLPATRPFRDYIGWLQKQDMNAANIFWSNKLKGFYAPTPLGFKESQNEHQGYGTIHFEIEKENTEKLTLLANSAHVTLNTIIQAAWSIILGRYSNETDVVFGATVSGRPPEIPDVESMVGLFINTLPVRVDLSVDLTVNDLLKNIQHEGVELRDYEFSPLAEIQRWSNIENNAELFNSIIVFENYPIEKSMQEQKISISASDFNSFEQTNFPLTLAVAARDSMHVQFAYQQSLFSKQGIENIFERLKNILLAFVENPNKKISSVSLLSQDEKSHILDDFNQSPFFSTPTTIIEMFENVVKELPEKAALVFYEPGYNNPSELTYNTLNIKVNQFAHYLLDQGVGLEKKVAISINPSFEMIIAILATLKAGGAYIPIDPEYPSERIDYILENSEIDILITQKSLAHNFANIKCPILIDTQEKDFLTYPETNPGIYPDLENLAYMIYTSGSTGKPKGTMLSHKNLASFGAHQTSQFGFDEKSRVLQFASISFDVSIIEIFGSFSNKSTLILADRAQMAPGQELVSLLKTAKISTAIIPPSVSSLIRDEDFPDLERLVSGGEAISPELAKHWSTKVKFINGYGPTEDTVCCTQYKEDDFRDSVPIGKPLNNTKIYILDFNQNVVPTGIPGELHISSTGLARGYFKRPDLTAEKFIPNPFSKDEGDRMYKTGDLCRYREDGNIEFIGRIDNQVKVRGFRIELGEIEHAVKEIEGINDCVVIVRKNSVGEAQIIAYYIPAKDADLDIKEIKGALQLTLPDYMIPAAFVKMSIFPLTTHAKIDKKALPEPEFESTLKSSEFVAPRNAGEETLSVIWSGILGTENIGVYDNFFDLGGHSLLATKLIARIREAFNIEIPLRTVFENSTIDKLFQQIEILRRQDANLHIPEIKAIDRNADIPVSLPQQRLWFIDQFSEGNSVYNIPFTTIINGALDTESFEKSINRVITRHESLRTHFINIKGVPFQKITEEMDYVLPVTDLSKTNPDDLQTEMLRHASEITNWQFDLGKSPLFKIELLKFAPQKYLLAAVMHHIISDGWSMNILIQEILQNYRAITLGQPEELQLPDLNVQYADFAAWQQDWIKGDFLEKQVTYWKDHLGLNPEVLELNTDYPRPAIQTFNGKDINFIIDENITNKIRAYGKKEGVTNFVTLMSAFQALLHRYSGQNQILVGSPVAGRHHAATQNLIGFFVNTLVIKAGFDQPQSFKALTKQVRENVLDAYAHQDIPFEQLVDALKVERDMAHSPLFQVAFVAQDAIGKLPETDALSFEPFETGSVVAKYDLSVYFTELEDRIGFRFEYNKDLFKKESIERIAEHYRLLLQQFIEEPKTRVDRANLITEEESKFVAVFNKTENQFDSDLCAHQRFEKMVLENPVHTALFINDATLTYDELNQRANQLARHILEYGVKADDIVGIHMERSFEMIIAMLAILKAGAAYLPLDPSYPAERLKYMMEDSGLKVLLTDQDDSLATDQDITILNFAGNSTLSYDTANLNLEVSPSNLAYVIYTSGSTGKPKGTMLSHTGLVNLANEQRKAFSIDTESKVLQFASLSFDAATWETVMALLNGASLYLVDREIIASGETLVKTIKEQKITTVTLPPSVLAVFPQSELPDLKTIITAGEKCPVDLVKKWQPGRNMVNAYGPTETSVCASMYFTNAEEQFDPPIGKSIGNFQLHVLDKNFFPVPVGVNGELCISGVGLARGYLNRPVTTAEKFIPNPFSEIPGDRLYRTGDLVKRRADGLIEFVGRIDYQVKVRGFRIELGEIESAINDCKKISDLFVTVREDIPGNQKIVAYLVDDKNRDIVALRKELLKTLPEYMVPSAFVLLDEIPLTPNGKIDRKALPAPEQDRSQLSKKYEAPRNENEEKLVQIVSELLHVEKVGIHDNFFELGGHSLLATQFVSKIRETFALELPLRKIFQAPTVVAIAEALLGPDARQADDDEPQIEALERSGDEDLESLLGELEGLSDEEVQAMLGSDEDATDDNPENND